MVRPLVTTKWEMNIYVTQEKLKRLCERERTIPRRRPLSIRRWQVQGVSVNTAEWSQPGKKKVCRLWKYSTGKLLNNPCILCIAVFLIRRSGNIIQGYSERSIHFKKCISQVLLNMWRCAIYGLKRELSQLFSRLTSTRCEPHVWSIIQFFPHSSRHVTGNSSHNFSDAPLQIIDIRTSRDFLSIRTQDMDLTSVVFVKWVFESV
jgi:hypothetical protein